MKFFYTFIFLLSFSAEIKSQQNDTLLARLITNLRDFYTLNPYEKCVTQTDKQFYQPGEKIWFTSHLLLYDRPSTLSKVMYTDVSDANGKLILKQMWPARDSKVEGSIYLPDSLATGIYRLRSYSLWMLNQPESVHEVYFFVSGKKDQATTFTTAPSPAVLRLYPQGEQLIEEQVNRISFTFYRKDGLPVTDIFSYELLEEGGIKVPADFFYYKGVGSLEFIPTANKKYFLRVKETRSAEETSTLPAVQKKQLCLKVSNLSASKLLVETVVDDAFIETHKSVLLLAEQNGQVVFISRLKLEEGEKAALIQKKNVSGGLIHITAFDEQLKVLSEKWSIVVKNPTSSIEIKNIQFTGKSKTLHSFELQANNLESANLGISIIPADLPAPVFIATNYFPASILASASKQQDKKIYVEWKDVPDSLTGKYSDALSLTIKPPYFNWQQVFSSKQAPLNYFFETGISVRGYIKKEKNTLPYDSTGVELITKGEDSTTIISYAKADSRGAFAVNDLGFLKKATLYIQAVTKEKKKGSPAFDLLPAYIDTFSVISSAFLLEPKLVPEKVTTEEQQVFEKKYSNYNPGKELKEIIVKGKKNSKEDSLSNVYASELFKNSDFTFIPNQNFGYASVWQVLQENIPGLYVSSVTATEPFVAFNRYTLSNERVSNGDGSANSVSALPIAFFLNEIPVDLFEVAMINPKDIALLKANRTPNVLIGSFANAAGAEGSIMIYTKKNANSKFQFETKAITGYAFSPTFYMPDYSLPQQTEIEDRRTTLLWIPQLKFDKTGKATIRFYNNSFTQKFKVVVQGFDKEGNPFFFEKRID